MIATLFLLGVFVCVFCYAGYPEFGLNALLGVTCVVFVTEVLFPTVEEWFPRFDTRRTKMTLLSVAGTIGLAATVYLRVTGSLS